MTPQKCVNIGAATLYLGDCTQIIESGLLACDAIVSDPPYGIAYKHFGGGGNFPSVKICTDVILGDERDFDPTIWLQHAPKVTPHNGQSGARILLWGADHFRSRLPAFGTLLAWDKHLGIAADDQFTDCEWAWCGKKVKREVFRYLWKGLFRNRNRDDDAPPDAGQPRRGATRFARMHVSQKPVELMRWCIAKLKPPEGGIILDPYMGSGSTAIAALSMGYRFVGCELDEAHFNTACRRIDAFVNRHDETLYVSRKML